MRAVLKSLCLVSCLWGISTLASAEGANQATHVHASWVGRHSGWGGWNRPVVVGWWPGYGYCGVYGFGPYWDTWGYCGNYWGPWWTPGVNQSSGQPGITYQWDAQSHRYVPVATKMDLQIETAQLGMSGDLFMYPKNGQNEEQQAKDKFECHQWAHNQTGFDPTQPAPANQGAQAIAAKTVDYRRAMAACLDGRGYSVQ